MVMLVQCKHINRLRFDPIYTSEGNETLVSSLPPKACSTLLVMNNHAQ